MKNLTLKKAIYGVTTSGLPAAFVFHIEFLNSKNSKYHLIPTFVRGLEFNQNPLTDYCDEIILHLYLSGNEYALMYENMQDLYCVMLISYTNVTGVKNAKLQPVKKKYRAALVNPQDLRKVRTDIQHYKEVDMVVEIKLIEETVYEARSVQLNGIYTRTTLTDAIHHLALGFGFKNVTMEKASNIHIYDHIVIPPMKNLCDCFPYLQEEYGVYEKGLAYFVTHDDLFIYAPFNLTPKTDTHVNIYQAQPNYTLASDCTMKLQKNLIEIVTKDVEFGIDHSVYGAENEGTSYTFLRSSEVQDGVITYHPQRPIEFKKDVTLTIGLAEPRSLTKKVSRPKYATTTDNVFALASMVYEHQSTHVKVSVAHSLPFALRPGLLVNYYWDDSGKLKKKTGIIESISSIFQPSQMGAQNTTHDIYVFRAESYLTLRLLPYDIEVKSIETTNKTPTTPSQGA